jgi:hypothetical protein
MYTGVSIPWLDAESDLYVGLMHMDARNLEPQTARVNFFRVEVSAVPEPSTSLLVLSIGIAISGRRRLPAGQRRETPGGIRGRAMSYRALLAPLS